MLIEIGALTLAAAVVVAVGWVTSHGGRGRYAVAFVAVLALEATANRVPAALGVPDAAGPWLGRALSLLLVAVVVWRVPLGRVELGLTTRVRPGTLRPAMAALVVAIAVVGVNLALSGPPEQDPDLGPASLLYEGVVFVAAEELVYRGVLLALLAGAVGLDLTRQRPGRLRTAFLVVAVAGLYAAARASLGAQGFDVDEFVSLLVIRAVFVWARVATGSLVVTAVAGLVGNLSAATILAVLTA